MKYIIEVDDKTSKGRSLITLVRSMNTLPHEVSMKSERELENMEDFAIGSAIQKKRTGKFVSRERIMSLLE